VYAPGKIAVALPAIATFTFTAPTACGGVVAVIVVALITCTFAAVAVSKITDAPFVNPAPINVTLAPPPTGPIAGLMLVSTGLTAMAVCEPVMPLGAVAVRDWGPAVARVAEKVWVPWSAAVKV
jgi:hypothetical protein